MFNLFMVLSWWQNRFDAGQRQVASDQADQLALCVLIKDLS